MKFSKQTIKNHERALTILQKEQLTKEEKIFCFDNWLPALAITDSPWRNQAFFTSLPLAQQVAMEFDTKNGVYVDICAGIGVLAFALLERFNASWDEGSPTVICIEKEPIFIEVGKKLVPQVIWIEGDALSEELWNSLPRQPDFFVSNPPFNISDSSQLKWLESPETCLKFIEAGLRKTTMRSGVAILPQKYASYIHETYKVREQGGNEYKKSKISVNLGKDRKAKEWEQKLDISNTSPVFYAPEEIGYPFRGTTISTEVIDYVMS